MRNALFALRLRCIYILSIIYCCTECRNTLLPAFVVKAWSRQIIDLIDWMACEHWYVHTKISSKIPSDAVVIQPARFSSECICQLVVPWWCSSLFLQWFVGEKESQMFGWMEREKRFRQWQLFYDTSWLMFHIFHKDDSWWTIVSLGGASL